MPRTKFRNFLKRNSRSRHSGSQERYSSDSSGKYEYGVDYTGAGRSQTEKNRSLGSTFSLKNRLPKNQQVHRSSRSLGDAEVNGRLITALKESFQDSESEDDFYEGENRFIDRKFSAVREENDEDGDASTHGMQELDRACVRLDGIEVYAIVSALTCATAINCFDNYDPTPLAVIVKERAVFTLLSEMFYYLSGALGMMTGLHATLIFSLVTMYGRTALGIDRDDAFNDFFANTGAARFNGFWSFKLSLYCFMIQLSFLVARKFFFEPLRPLVLLGTGYLAYTNLYCDAEDVLSAAGVIYSSPPESEPEEESVEPEDRRAALRRRASTERKKSYLSTRNFGIDTKRSSFSLPKLN
jgi:hypothetical protein